jgi:DNA-binding HxlR family transcriptional regulator
MAKVLSLGDLALQSRDAIDLLSNKWRIPILHILRNGPLRTNALQGAMSQVSAKVLTQTLRGMERDGLIDRRIFNVAPPRVEYVVTDMGRSLIKPLQDLCQWAESHVAERDAARKKFDLTIKATKSSSTPQTRSQKS